MEAKRLVLLITDFSCSMDAVWWSFKFMIDEMCMLLDVKKLWTMPYHPQTIGLVERSHQTIMWMIGKLGEAKKANWPGHLAEIVQAYNATCSAVTGYSPHYLMLGYRARLPVDFYFPTLRSTEVPMRGTSTKHVDKYVATVHDQFRATLQEAQAQSMAEAQWQKWYCDWKIGAMELEPGDLVLVKADAFKGKRKIKDRWEDKACEVVHQSCILHHSQLLLVPSETGVPLCVGICQAWDWCTSPTPVKPTPKGSGNMIMPWVASGLATTQHQTSKTSLGWINGKLWILPWMSTRASTEDG